MKLRILNGQITLIIQALKAITWALKTEIQRKSHKKEGSMTRNAEFEAMQTQAKECQHQEKLER